MVGLLKELDRKYMFDYEFSVLRGSWNRQNCLKTFKTVKEVKAGIKDEKNKWGKDKFRSPRIIEIVRTIIEEIK